MVDLVQAAFGEGWLAEEATWKAALLIPKGGGDYRNIIPVEVVWKVVNVILNLRFKTSTTFHHVLHCFWSGCVTGTA